MTTIVYVDGENLLHRVEDILAERRLISHKTEITHFQLAKFVHELIPEVIEPQIRYYGTKLKRAGILDDGMLAKATIMIESQRRLKRDLDRQKIEFIHSGNLRIRTGLACRECGRSDDIFQEKGVDVRIAVDMVSEASSNIRQVLISSDSDLLPAVKAARQNGSKITYITYEASVNRALVSTTDIVRTYTASQVIEAFIIDKGSK